MWKHTPAPALAALLLAATIPAHARDARPTPPAPPPPPAPPGPAARTRPPAYPAPPPAAGPYDAVFDPEEPDLRLVMSTGYVPMVHVFHRHWFGWHYRMAYATRYESICQGPCTARFEPGEYDMALEKPDGRLVPSSEPVVIRGPSRLRASFVDRSGARIAGTAIGVTGVIAGIVLIVASAQTDHVCYPDGCYARDTVNGPLLAGGIGAIIGSTIAALVLHAQEDEAHITVSPLGVARLETPFAARSASAAQGLSVGLRF